MKLLASGKVKEVYELSPDTLRFRFSDRISVFDKVIPSLIPRKGESLCRTSAHWFAMAGQMGIDTHFVSMPSPNEMNVKRVSQQANLKLDRKSRKNVMVPMEFICRHYVAGSFWDRLKKGEVKGISAKGLKYGDRLPEPVFEFTTKFEKYDRLLDEKEAVGGLGMTKKELADIRELVFKIDERMNQEVGARGLIHVDGKKELALNAKGQLMLIDTFGTADEDRFWDKAKYDAGEFSELSKEFVRQHYRSTGYHKALMDARDAGKPEPDIPALPQEIINATSQLYGELFEMITGEEF
jgi:phosphoribosylaminoimidazole-succinocarboxamide synthase